MVMVHHWKKPNCRESENMFCGDNIPTFHLTPSASRATSRAMEECVVLSFEEAKCFLL
jgi:hypothetical protein